jgi:formylglycine-generating enzyme required for sulfatase activity
MKFAVSFLLTAMCGVTHAQNEAMALVKGGSYVPLYSDKETAVQVHDFLLDVTPVTHEQYSAFVKTHPQWKRSRVSRLFADEYYLKDWINDTIPGDARLKTPVNYVSWFAAKAYCESQGKRLPTVDEWEYAAMADEHRRDARKDSVFNQRVIRGYETPQSHLKPVGTSPANYWGIKDLHGLVWEWTLDFNSVILTSDSRNQDDTNNTNLWCGGAAINANDLMNYAAFMRYALRSSLKARYALKSLGFRCAKDANKSTLNP